MPGGFPAPRLTGELDARVRGSAWAPCAGAGWPAPLARRARALDELDDELLLLERKPLPSITSVRCSGLKVARDRHAHGHAARAAAAPAQGHPHADALSGAHAPRARGADDHVVDHTALGARR